MKITVTAEDIKEGHRGNACLCPIALAMIRATKDEWAVGTFSVRRRYQRRAFALPKRVMAWIFRFDIGKEVKPFSFTLDL